MGSAIKRLGDIHPLCCLHSAVEDNYLDEVWEAFLESAQQCRDEIDPRLFKRFELEALEGSLISIFEDGIFDEFINIFFSDACARIVDDDAQADALEVCRVYIVDLIEKFISQGALERVDLSDSYCYLYFKHCTPWFSLVAALSSPFIALFYRIEPTELPENIFHEAGKLVAGRLWIPAQQVCYRFSDEQIGAELLHVGICNIPGILIAELNGESYYGNSFYLIRYAKLWLKKVAPNLYSKYGDFVETHPQEAELLLSGILDRPDGCCVNWDHACLSLRSASEELGALMTRQFIDADLHAAIVGFLNKLGRAMSFVDIESELGFRVDFDPLELGPATRPGSIALYGRHERFVTKDGAFFVLWEWIETDSQKKGRIPRNRIVSPLVVRDVEISRDVIIGILDQLPFWERWGVERLSSLVDEIEKVCFKIKLEGFYRRVLGSHIKRVCRPYVVFNKPDSLLCAEKFASLGHLMDAADSREVAENVWRSLVLERDVLGSRDSVELHRILR